MAATMGELDGRTISLDGTLGGTDEETEARRAVEALTSFSDERTPEQLQMIWRYVQSRPATRQYFRFRHVKADARGNLISGMRLLTAARGTVLYRQGEVGQSFFIVVAGRCEVYHQPVTIAEAEAAAAAGGGDLAQAALGTEGGMMATMQRRDMGVLIGTLSPGSCFGETTAARETLMRRQVSIASAGGAPTPAGARGRPTASNDKNMTIVLQVPMAAYTACSKLKFRGKNLARRKRVAALKPLHLFADWPDTELDLLCNYMRDSTAAAGSSIYIEGQQSDYVYFLVSGEVAIQTTHPEEDGVTVNLEHIVSPNFFGEVEVVEGADAPDSLPPRSNTAVALSKCSMFALPVQVFRQMLLSPAAEKAFFSAVWLKNMVARRSKWRDTRLEHALRLTAPKSLGGQGSAVGLPVPFLFTNRAQSKVIPCTLCDDMRHLPDECPTLGPSAEELEAKRVSEEAQAAKERATKGHGAARGRKARRFVKAYIEPKAHGIKGRMDNLTTWKTENYEKQVKDGALAAAVQAGLSARDADDDDDFITPEAAAAALGGAGGRSPAPLSPNGGKAPEAAAASGGEDWNKKPTETMSSTARDMQRDVRDADKELKVIVNAIAMFKNVLGKKRDEMGKTATMEGPAPSEDGSSAAMGHRDAISAGSTIKGFILPKSSRVRELRTRGSGGGPRRPTRGAPDKPLPDKPLPEPSDARSRRRSAPSRGGGLSAVRTLAGSGRGGMPDSDFDDDVDSDAPGPSRRLSAPDRPLPGVRAPSRGSSRLASRGSSRLGSRGSSRQGARRAERLGNGLRHPPSRERGLGDAPSQRKLRGPPGARGSHAMPQPEPESRRTYRPGSASRTGALPRPGSSSRRGGASERLPRPRSAPRKDDSGSSAMPISMGTGAATRAAARASFSRRTGESA